MRLPFANQELARLAKNRLTEIADELSALAAPWKPDSLDRAAKAVERLRGRVTAAVECLTLLPLAPAASDLGATYCAVEDALERIVRVHYDNQKPGSARLGEKRFVLPLAPRDFRRAHYDEDERFLFPRAPTDDAEYQQLQEQLWRVFNDAVIKAQRVAAKLAEFLADRLNDGNGGGQGGKGAGKSAANKPGRKPKARLSKVDRVIRSMIDCGDVNNYARKWKDLRQRYADQLPMRMDHDALRKRVEREEARREADKK